MDYIQTVLLPTTMKSRAQPKILKAGDTAARHLANNGSGSSWDGNSTTTTGYPCLDGVGRGQGQALNGADFKPYSSTGPLNTTTGAKTWPHEYLEPVYMWGTTNNGVPLLSLQDTVTQNNRDVYVDRREF